MAHGDLLALAFDHRRQLEAMADKEGAPRERLKRLKGLIAEAAARRANAVLVDDKWGEEALRRLEGTSIFIARPVETPGSRPLTFEGGPDVGGTIRPWPRAHVVKCLVFYHPDDAEELRRAQEATVTKLAAACRELERELLLEVILPKDVPSDDLTLARALAAIYAAGIKPAWWKLPPPATTAGWEAVEREIEGNDAACRGILLLGLDAPEAELAASFRVAAGRAWCKGFAVGRTIFGAPAADWLGGRIDDDTLVARVEAAYLRVVDMWRSR